MRRIGSTMYRMTSPHLPHSPALGRVLATVSVGFVVTQLDVTIVNIALPKIGADLHANVAGLQWVVDAYTLAFAVLMLSAGALGDRFGARRLYAAGIVLFALASLACGLALDAALLVAARALQGVGAAAMLSVRGIIPPATPRTRSISRRAPSSAILPAKIRAKSTCCAPTPRRCRSAP